MKANGITVLQNMVKTMPNATQKDMHAALQDVIKSGASEFFKNMTPKTVISLPLIYVLNPDDIFELEGKRYVTIEVHDGSNFTTPGITGQKYTSPSNIEYPKGTKIPGEVEALNLDTGEPEILPLPLVREKITKPTENAENLAKKANEKIAQYNEKIKSISKATGASKLVLQIESAKQNVEQRMEDLKNIIFYDQQKLENVQKDPLSAFENYAQDLKNQVESGKLSLKDAYDTILYLYQSIPEKLVSDIESGKIKIPEELKMGILTIAKREIESTKSKTQQKQLNDAKELEIIQKRDIPEIHDTEMEYFTPQDIPGSKQKYKEIDTKKSMWSYIASIKKSLLGSKKDYEELTLIRDSINNMERYMGELQKGQRSKKFLLSPEGKPILDEMNNFLNESSLFIKRYAVNIIQDGKVNSKLMGPKGTAGNALLAISLTKMYNIVKETIAMYSTDPIITEPNKELPQPSKPTIKEPIANTENQITKLSNALWSAFEDRMRAK